MGKSLQETARSGKVRTFKKKLWKGSQAGPTPPSIGEKRRARTVPLPKRSANQGSKLRKKCKEKHLLTRPIRSLGGGGKRETQNKQLGRGNTNFEGEAHNL